MAARAKAENSIWYRETKSLNSTPTSMKATKKKSTVGAISKNSPTSQRLIDCKLMRALFQEAC